MKNKLLYQITEFDCVPICIINSLIYFYKREEIDVNILKYIWNFSLDLDNDGTSKNSIKKIINFLNNNLSKTKFEIKEQNEVNLVNIIKCLNNNGVVILRTYLKDGHYILITNYNTKYILAFDPYKLSKESLNNYVKDSDKIYYNRKINYKRFIDSSKKNFSLGPLKERFAIFVSM